MTDDCNLLTGNLYLSPDIKNDIIKIYFDFLENTLATGILN
jgi:hypothetical protein